ncbi:MAG: hypothetical protein ACFFAN_19285, partial [Promethearchaeota archaeon]
SHIITTLGAAAALKATIIISPVNNAKLNLLKLFKIVKNFYKISLYEDYINMPYSRRLKPVTTIQ